MLANAHNLRNAKASSALQGAPYPLGEYPVFNSAKQEFALLLTALAIAAGLMALTANFALDRLSADHLERHDEPKRSALVR